MGIRYEDRIILINEDQQYEHLFRERRKNFIRHYKTANLRSIGENDEFDLQEAEVVWTSGQKFWKLAQQYYGDPGLWWIIAWYNLSPTEHHVDNGAIVSIPFPIQRVTQIMRSLDGE